MSLLIKALEQAERRHRQATGQAAQTLEAAADDLAGIAAGASDARRDGAARPQASDDGSRRHRPVRGPALALALEPAAEAPDGTAPQHATQQGAGRDRDSAAAATLADRPALAHAPSFAELPSFANGPSFAGESSFEGGPSFANGPSVADEAPFVDEPSLVEPSVADAASFADSSSFPDSSIIAAPLAAADSAARATEAVDPETRPLPARSTARSSEALGGDWSTPSGRTQFAIGTAAGRAEAFPSERSRIDQIATDWPQIAGSTGRPATDARHDDVAPLRSAGTERRNRLILWSIVAAATAGVAGWFGFQLLAPGGDDFGAVAAHPAFGQQALPTPVPPTAAIGTEADATGTTATVTAPLQTAPPTAAPAPATSPAPAPLQSAGTDTMVATPERTGRGQQGAASTAGQAPSSERSASSTPSASSTSHLTPSASSTSSASSAPSAPSASSASVASGKAVVARPDVAPLAAARAALPSSLPATIAGDTGTTKFRPPASAPGIRLLPGTSREESIAAQLESGYRALAANDRATATRAYETALTLDRNNADALVGLATLASRDGEPLRAERLLSRALQADPSHAGARAAALALQGHSDPVAEESQLRNLIAADGSQPSLWHALGNALARQQRWPDAQQAYFNAVAGDPEQPDYTFNLAVSLERLRQPRAALDHYRRALVLAGRRGGGFDLALARARVTTLEQRLDAAAP